MYVRGLTYYENHFLYSNKLFQFIMGLRPYQNSNFQLFQLCTTIVYMVPIFVHSLYPLFTSDVELQSTIRVLQNILAGLSILCIYVTNCTSLVQMFQLASTLQSKSYLIECCIYIGGSGFMTYVTFHFGQKLINHSTEIFDEL
ncbi:hypothetical protein M0804_007456 [Polistes exclamans]|nr:hypothetical protein M0804_007456 [Polistes exclamans]